MRKIGKLISLAGLLLFAASTSTTIVGQEIGLGLMFLGWLILWLTRGVPAMNSLSLELPIAALAGAWALSTVFALQPAQSLLNMKKIFLLAILYGFAWLIEDEGALRKVIIIMLLAAGIVSIYGITNYVMGVNLEEAGRVRALFGSTVTLAGVMLLVFSVSLSLVLIGQGGRWRPFFYLATLLSYVCLILTYTRGAWLGAIAVLIVVFWFPIGRRKTALLISIMLLVVTPLASKNVRQRVESSTQMQEAPIRGRISMWLSASEVAKDHPLFGVGMMDLGRVYEEYKRPDYGFSSGHMHSDFFHTLASTGLLGLAAFLWFLRSVCSLLLRNLQSVGRGQGLLEAVCLGSLAGFCGFIVAGVFEWNFGDVEVVSLLYCLVGLTCSAARLQRQAQLSPYRADPLGS